MVRMLCLLVALLAPSALAQRVAYEKRTLPNGMVVILHEDRSLPIATINTWYRVGAQDEPPGRSGFAHLFEHLMFMGTSRVPDNQFDVIMETGGGANNATTDLHRTNYFSWGPASLLPTLLWLDADRLEDMGREMNQEKLDKQRDVVRNELRQMVENAPYGKATEMVFKLLFEPGHPYYHGVIGTHRDLEAATVADVKDFFATFYVPNNASLVVAGDFDSAEVWPFVEALFGTIPAGQPVTRKYRQPMEAIPGRLEGERRFTAIDRVEQARIEFSYHSPVGFGPGDAEMSLAASILGSGKSSRLYKRLVIEEQLAAEVDATQQGYPLGGIFQVAVYARSGADLNRVEAIMDEELTRFVEHGPSESELEERKATVELAVLSGLQSLERRADRMNEYEFHWGEPDGFARDLERYRGATVASVREWAARTLRPDSRVVIRVLPEAAERETSPRDLTPLLGETGRFSFPEAETYTLPNGLRVRVWNRPEVPLVSMHLLCRPGGALDAPHRQGRASLTAQMLGEGAGDLDAVAFENAVRAIGGSFDTDAGRETLTVSMTVLKRNFGRGAGLFADAILRPRFDEHEWERVRALRIEEIRQSLEVPGAIAGRVASRLLFGDAHPMGWSVLGTVQGVESLTVLEMRALWNAWLLPANCELLIAGDVTASEARPVINRLFVNWTGGSEGQVEEAPPAPPRNWMDVAIVDRPGATQTFIRFYAPGAAFSDAGRVERRLLNTILGGSFTSRLNQNLREEKGYTYGARSFFEMERAAGAFGAGASVFAEATGAALAEFLREFDRIRAGDISEEEAAKARETVRNDAIRSLQTLSGLLNAASVMIANGQAPGGISEDLVRAAEITADELNALAARAVTARRGVLVLVGDKRLILEQIRDLGLPEPREFRASGEPADR